MGVRLEMDWVVFGAEDAAVGLEWPGFELRMGMGLGRLGGSVGEASAFGSGYDPRLLGSSPASGSLLRGEPASSSSASLSLSVSHE